MFWVTLLTSLSIAGVAGWYSIVGLMAIFSGSAISIAIMGGVLEVGKLVTASWLHSNWKGLQWWLKLYLTSAVVVLMLITSLGIFGYLSKAHLEHSISTGGTNELQIENLQRQIGNQQRSIKDAETVLSQLDATVQTLIDYDRIRGKDGAIATRQAQGEERATQNESINNAYANIERLQSSLSPLQRERLEIEVEVGPLKYIAELIYGDDAENMFDEAVRVVILLLIFVFDPLAIALLLVATRDLTTNNRRKDYYDDGNLKVHPSNVVDVDDSLTEMTFEDDIPEDEDLSEYEVVVAEEEDPTEIIRRRKHEDGWYTQGGTPKI
jgi:hypothetical protein